MSFLITSRTRRSGLRTDLWLQAGIYWYSSNGSTSNQSNTNIVHDVHASILSISSNYLIYLKQPFVWSTLFYTKHQLTGIWALNYRFYSKSEYELSDYEQNKEVGVRADLWLQAGIYWYSSNGSTSNQSNTNIVHDVHASIWSISSTYLIYLKQPFVWSTLFYTKHQLTCIWALNYLFYSKVFSQPVRSIQILNKPWNMNPY